MAAERSENAVCDCGHVDAAHEEAVRVGRAWFTPELADEQGVEGVTWHYCGHCEDGCYVVERAAPSGGTAQPPEVDL